MGVLLIFLIIIIAGAQKGEDFEEESIGITPGNQIIRDKYRGMAYNVKPWSLDTALEGLNMYEEYNYGTALLCIPIDNKFDTNEPICDISDKQLNKVMDLAESQRLDVILKCHNASNNTDGQGNTNQPTDPEKWFKNYKKIVERIADVAVDRGYEELIISNEMHNVLNIKEWKPYFVPIIESVQEKGLRVSCSTNIPEIREKDGFQYWDELDFFSVNTYPQLTKSGKWWARRNFEKLKEGFYVATSDIDVNYGELFKNLGGADNLHKDIWITEVGCIPNKDGLLYPAYWGGGKFKDEEIQKLYMDAVMDVLENDQESGKLTDRIKRYVVWDGNSDSDFNMIGKKGEAILDKYWDN